jgi:hypothetical protein
MRIKHGNLYKVMSLADIYKIQWGSITLVSSVSHLTLAGLDAYVADMADIISQFKARLGGIVEIFTIAPLLLGRCEDQSLTRAVFDSWL